MTMAESLRRVEQEVLSKRSEYGFVFFLHDSPILTSVHPRTRPGSLPPPRPSIFCGRAELVSQVLDVLSVQGSERRHVALLGPGGIGKSSLAKAILNEPLIAAEYKSRRFFTRFDDILASQITYSTFIERVARTLGLPSSGHHGPILEFLGSEDTLLALDNAETFLDPESSRDVSRIKSAIDEFGGFPSVSIVLTSRSRELPRGLLWKKLEVPSLDAHPAYELFTKIFQRPISESRSTLESILSVVDYHPLTISLLAHVAEVNDWSIEELSERWNAQRSQLLNAGHGKDYNLAESIELSLGSPCIRLHGDGVQRVLRIMAFFPQGLSRKNLKRMLPSISHVQGIIEVLHKQSLVAFNEGFITMLAPVRIYATDNIPGPDPSLLEAARNYYYSELLSPADQVDVLVTSEDVNIESLIAFDLSHLCEEDLLTALKACRSFLFYLHDLKSRPTCLRPIIDAVDSSRSLTMNAVKIQCFHELAQLCFLQSNYLESLELSGLTYDLAQEAGLKIQALDSILHMADTHCLLGQDRIAQQLLETVQASENWSAAMPYHKAYVVSTWGFIKQCSDAQITGASLAAFFRESERLFRVGETYLWDADLSGAQSAFALALVDKNMGAARVVLESAITENCDRDSICYFFFSLACLSFMERKLEDAKRLLNLSRASYIRANWMTEATFILLDLAVIATAEGKFDDAKDLIKRSREELRIHGIVSAENQWLTLYTSGIVEFASGHFLEAQQLFEQAKEYCIAQQEFQIRAFSIRAMGEIAYLQKDSARAKAYFEETVSTCHDAGIIPELLYRRSSQAFFNNAPPTTCEGWPHFLRRRGASIH